MNTPTNPDLVAIAQSSVAELTTKLDGLSAAQLAELHALESAAPNGGRVTALAAIEAELERARKLGDESAADAQAAIAALDAAGITQDSPPAPGDEGGAQGAAGGDGATPPHGAATSPSPPKWQAPDYTGPLTGDQAQWRLRHVKPVVAVSTK